MNHRINGLKNKARALEFENLNYEKIKRKGISTYCVVKIQQVVVQKLPGFF